MNIFCSIFLGAVIGLAIALIKFCYDINKTKVDWKKDWGGKKEHYEKTNKK